MSEGRGRLPSRRWLLRRLAVVGIVALLVPVVVPALTYTPPTLERGTVEQPAEGPTVVGVQGFHFRGEGATKKPARLLSLSGAARFKWQFDGSRVGASWYYDVDPLPDGDVLVVSTNPGGTVVFRMDRSSRKILWTERLPYHDTHDVDYLGDGKLLVGHMRNWNNSSGVPDDRVVVYDRHSDEVVWEWVVRKHYPKSMDGGYHKDWSHLNDVDKVGEGLYLVSLRNFDQVVVVNRSTKEIEMKLGRDGAHDILNEQHNPDLLRSKNGTPHVLVADSENDRVVEYARRCPGAGGNGILEADPEDCHWTLVWSVGTGQLNWPRDADRLPNGNTLITDTLNHRVIEVTPQGKIVWEYYATWGPYDAERIGIHPANRSTTGGSRGPTMSDVGVTGSYRLSNSAGITPATGKGKSFHGAVVATFEGTPLAGAAKSFAAKWAHVTPWFRPNWMSGWTLASFFGAVLLALGWAAGETVAGRDHIRSRLGDAWHRVAS